MEYQKGVLGVLARKEKIGKKFWSAGSPGLRPVVTGYLFFRPLFAETSYVRFVPASDYLGIAFFFHD